MSIHKLAEMVAETDNNTTLTVSVDSGGYQTFNLERRVGGKQKPVVMQHSAPNVIHDLDGMAQRTIESLAKKALGIKDEE